MPRQVVEGDTRSGWLVLGAIALANFVVAAVHFGLAAAGPSIRTELAIDVGALGILLAAPAIGLMVGTYWWGVLADRVSERRVLTGAFVGFAAATWCAGTIVDADRIGVLFVLLLVSGAFGSAAHSAGGRVITASFPQHRHGLVLSIRHVAIPIGAAIGGLVVPFVTHERGLGDALVLGAGSGAIAALVLGIVVPSSRTRVARAARAAMPSPGRSPMQVPAMWLLAVGAASLAFVQLGIGSFLTLQLVDEAGLALALAAAAFTAAQLGGAVGRIVLGMLSDRVRNRIVILQAVAAATLLLTVVAVIATIGSNDIVAGSACALALVVVTSCNGVVVAVAASLAPPGRTGATLGMQTTANAAACAVAPIVLGLVLERSSWTGFCIVLAGVLMVSNAALMRLRRVG